MQGTLLVFSLQQQIHKECPKHWRRSGFSTAEAKAARLLSLWPVQRVHENNAFFEQRP